MGTSAGQRRRAPTSRSSPAGTFGVFSRLVAGRGLLDRAGRALRAGSGRGGRAHGRTAGSRRDHVRRGPGGPGAADRRRTAGAGRRPGRPDRALPRPSLAAAEAVFGVLAAGVLLLRSRVDGRLGRSPPERLGAKVLVTDGLGLEPGCGPRAATSRASPAPTVDGTEGKGIAGRRSTTTPPHPAGRSDDPRAADVHLGHQRLAQGHPARPPGAAGRRRSGGLRLRVVPAGDARRRDGRLGVDRWPHAGLLLVPWSFGVPVVAQRHTRFDANATLDLFARCGVTTAFLPPSVLRLLQANGRAPERRLRAVVTGGEAGGALGDGVVPAAPVAGREQGVRPDRGERVIGDSAALAARYRRHDGRPVSGSHHRAARRGRPGGRSR